MNKKDQELYICTLCNTINRISKISRFSVNQIYYDNVELAIETMNIEDTSIENFTISFQKQNGGFSLVTNKSLNDAKKQKIINLLESIIKIDLFASYKFIDMQDKNIDHFVYDDSKLDFNMNILENLESTNQIIDLSIIEKSSFDQKKR